jgi:hypothetical protein
MTVSRCKSCFSAGVVVINPVFNISHLITTADHGEKRGYYTHYGVDREKLKEFAAIIMDLASREPQTEGSCRKESGACRCARKEK